MLGRRLLDIVFNCLVRHGGTPSPLPPPPPTHFKESKIYSHEGKPPCHIKKSVLCFKGSHSMRLSTVTKTGNKINLVENIENFHSSTESQIQIQNFDVIEKKILFLVKKISGKVFFDKKNSLTCRVLK
jgi:hypothetical protein